MLLEKGIKAPSGKVSVTGKVLSQKFVENDFGGNVKMLVEAEEGYKVWLTRPSSISEVEVGDKIQFNANLTPSLQDQLFAIGKNPSKATILEGKVSI